MRAERWPDSVPVESEACDEKVRRELDIGTRTRDLSEAGGTLALRKPGRAQSTEAPRRAREPHHSSLVTGVSQP